MKPLRIFTNQFFCYLLIGASNTAICLVLMYVGARLGLGYLEYTVLGYLVTIVFSFFMNLHFTFKVEGELLKRFSLYFLVSFINLMLVELIEFTLIESYDANHLFAIFCGMSWYLLAGFTLNNMLVYRKNMWSHRV